MLDYFIIRIIIYFILAVITTAIFFYDKPIIMFVNILNSKFTKLINYLPNTFIFIVSMLIFAVCVVCLEVIIMLLPYVMFILSDFLSLMIDIPWLLRFIILPIIRRFTQVLYFVEEPFSGFYIENPTFYGMFFW